MEAYGQAVVVRVHLRACVAEEFGNFHLEFDLSESRRITQNRLFRWCQGGKGARTPEIDPFRFAGLLPCSLLGEASHSRCALKDKFAALSVRKGHKKLIVALAHLGYSMFADKQALTTQNLAHFHGVQ